MPQSILSITGTDTILQSLAEKELKNKLHTNSEQAATKKNKDMVK